VVILANPEVELEHSNQEHPETSPQDEQLVSCLQSTEEEEQAFSCEHWPSALQMSEVQMSPSSQDTGW